MAPNATASRSGLGSAKPTLATGALRTLTPEGVPGELASPAGGLLEHFGASPWPPLLATTLGYPGRSVVDGWLSGRCPGGAPSVGSRDVA